MPDKGKGGISNNLLTVSHKILRLMQRCNIQLEIKSRGLKDSKTIINSNFYFS
jgi:hypothetical protein